MPSPSTNITNIPAPRVNLIDQRTGLMSREWYRFLLNIFTLTGSGQTTISLEDLQVLPASTAPGSMATYTFRGIPVNGGVIYGTGTQFRATAAGTSNQVLVSGGAASPIWTSSLTLTNLTATGTILSTGGKVGYTTGAGGAVTQLTSKSTAVTLDAPCGAITMNAAALAAGAAVQFTLNNSSIALRDCVLANVTGGTAGAYTLSVLTVAAGSAVLQLTNITAGSLSQSPVINFAVIKAVNA